MLYVMLYSVLPFLYHVISLYILFIYFIMFITTYVVLYHVLSLVVLRSHIIINIIFKILYVI